MPVARGWGMVRTGFSQATWLRPKTCNGKGEAQHGSRRDCIGLDFSIAMVCPAKP